MNTPKRLKNKETQYSTIFFCVGIILLLNLEYLVQKMVHVIALINKPLFYFLFDLSNKGMDTVLGIIAFSPVLVCLVFGLYFATSKQRTKWNPWKYYPLMGLSLFLIVCIIFASIDLLI